MTVTALGGVTPSLVAHDPIAGLTAGAVYTLTAQVYIPTGSPSVQPILLDNGLTGALVTARNTWVPVTFTFTAPTSTVRLGWVTDGTPADKTMVCYVDDVALRQTNAPVYFDGDSATDGTGEYRWTGTPGNSASVWRTPTEGMLAGPVYQPVNRLVAQWDITPLSTDPTIQVRVGAVSPDGGTVLDAWPTQSVTGATTVTWDGNPTPDQAFRPVLWVVGQGADFALTIYQHPVLTPEDCVAPYRRRYSQVTTVEGPLVTGSEVTDCGERLLYVSWTWVAGMPYRFGTDKVLTSGGDSTNLPSLEAQGVVTTPMGAISASPYNCTAPIQIITCVPDPCRPGFATPPAYPVIPDTSRPNITTQSVRAVSVLLPPEVIPNDEGVFTFRLKNDGSDKVGVRVRVYDGVPPSGTPPDLCDFAYEYLIDYIAPDATYVIDGVSGTGTVICPGYENQPPVDGSSVLRGSYGGPVQDPVASCDSRYYVIVQWLAAYPTSCPASGTNAGSIYTAGQPQGELAVEVSLAPREG